MKTVCLDLRALQIGHENRGIGMYIKSVLEHLPVDEDTHYLFYCFDKNDPVKSLGINVRVKYTLIQSRTINTVLDSPKNFFGIVRLLCHRFAPLRAYNLDTFVQFDFMLGLPRWRGLHKIVIGYDLIPLIMKNTYLPSVSVALRNATIYDISTRRFIDPIKLRLRKILPSFIINFLSLVILPIKVLLFVVHYPLRILRITKVLNYIFNLSRMQVATRALYYRFRFWLHYRVYKRANTVLCISKASAQSFEKLLGINPKRLIAIPLAPVSPDVKPDYSVAKTAKKPYILYIGGTDSRKSVKDIVYAYNIAKGRGADIALVLAGNEFREIKNLPDTAARNAILRSPYRQDIHLVGFVSDAEKLGLYKSARAFVFASRYEGFGLPVVEAMAASCPVITYDNSSIPEVAGDAAIMVETGNYVGIANGVVAVADPSYRNILIQLGLVQSAKFSWEKYASRFIDVL